MNTHRTATIILSLLVVLLPTYQIRFTIGVVPTTVLELGIIVLAVASIGFLTPKQSLAKRIQFFFTLEHPLLAIAIAIFVLSTTIAAILSPSVIAAAGLWKAYCIDAVLALYIARCAIRSMQHPLQTFSDVASILLLTLAGVAAIQYIHPSGILVAGRALFAITDPLWSARDTFRATSVFNYPNALGLLSAPLTILLSAVIIIYGFRRLWAAGFIAGLISISLANSNGAMLAVILGLLTVLILPHLSIRQCRTLLTIGAVLFILSPFVPVRRIIGPFIKTSPSSILRVEQYEETLALLHVHPFLGGGLGHYQQAIAPFHNNAQSGVPFLYPHNIILTLWSELGLFGLFSMMWIVLLTIRSLLSTADRRPYSWVLLAIWVTLITHGLVDVPYFKNDLAVLFWILIALSWSVLERPTFGIQSDRGQILASPTLPRV